MILELVLKVTAAYLLGSLSGSLLLGRLRGIDIRTQGSGNAGGTNALRTQGIRFALGVMIIDIGKGWLAAGWLPALGPAGVAPALLAAACGTAAMVGHVYPIFHGFRGGKGAATFVGAAAALLPGALIPVVGLWIALVLLTGYVGLATMSAAALFVPVCFWLAPRADWPTLLPFAVAGAVLIVYSHRSNIQRLLNGTENRFDKIRIVNWFR